MTQKHVATLSQEASKECQRAHASLLALADPDKACFLAGFFKTGPGQYGEGDQFLGMTVPTIRLLVRQFRLLSLVDCQVLLLSPYNEERLLSLLILVEQYRKGDAQTRDAVYRLYLQNRQRANNWNLVDSSAPYIVGAHLLKQPRTPLYELVQSGSLWDRRMAVLATLAFIRQNDFSDTLKLVELLLADKQDLMHKACGWMLREVGKRDVAVLERFLQQHQAAMPRTMLRYAIERLLPAQRSLWLAARGTSAPQKVGCQGHR